MENVVELQLKIACGTERIYPTNELARKLAQLAGKKTFSQEDLNLIKLMGFKVTWKPILE